MTPLLSLYLLLAAANDPLPKELEYRLTLARALPAPYSGAVIVALLPSAKLTPRQIVPLAEEAYQLAGKDSAVALRAWIVYRDNFDKQTNAALGFPVRAESVKAECAAREVDDPRDYYRWAMQAGAREFAMVTRTVRSAVDVGRLAEAVLEGGGEQQASLIVSGLQVAIRSDREFVEAMRFTGLHSSVLKIAEQSSVQVGRTLMGAYRLFLVTNWTNRRCAGNRAEEFQGVIEEFNQVAAKLRGVTPLTAEAALVKNVDTTTGDVEPSRFALIYKVVQAPLDDTSLRSMLTEVAQYRLEQKPGTNETTEEAKAYLYGKLTQRLDGSAMQTLAIEEFLKFVAASRLRTENPRVWFRCARAFYDWSRGNRTRQSSVEAAGEPALTAYIKLTTLLPESEVARVLP